MSYNGSPLPITGIVGRVDKNGHVDTSWAPEGSLITNVGFTSVFENGVYLITYEDPFDYTPAVFVTPNAADFGGGNVAAMSPIVFSENYQCTISFAILQFDQTDIQPISIRSAPARAGFWFAALAFPRVRR
jgi:hypothetical protein